MALILLVSNLVIILILAPVAIPRFGQWLIAAVQRPFEKTRKTYYRFMRQFDKNRFTVVVRRVGTLAQIHSDELELKLILSKHERQMDTVQARIFEKTGTERQRQTLYYKKTPIDLLDLTKRIDTDYGIRPLHRFPLPREKNPWYSFYRHPREDNHFLYYVGSYQWEPVVCWLRIQDATCNVYGEGFCVYLGGRFQVTGTYHPSRDGSDRASFFPEGDVLGEKEASVTHEQAVLELEDASPSGGQVELTALEGKGAPEAKKDDRKKGDRQVQINAPQSASSRPLNPMDLERLDEESSAVPRIEAKAEDERGNIVTLDLDLKFNLPLGYPSRFAEPPSVIMHPNEAIADPVRLYPLTRRTFARESKEVIKEESVLKLASRDDFQDIRESKYRRLNALTDHAFGDIKHWVMNGAGEQEFLPECLDRIEQLKRNVELETDLTLLSIFKIEGRLNLRRIFIVVPEVLLQPVAHHLEIFFLKEHDPDADIPMADRDLRRESQLYEDAGGGVQSPRARSVLGFFFNWKGQIPQDPQDQSPQGGLGGAHSRASFGSNLEQSRAAADRLGRGPLKHEGPRDSLGDVELSSVAQAKAALTGDADEPGEAKLHGELDLDSETPPPIRAAQAADEDDTPALPRGYDVSRASDLSDLDADEVHKTWDLGGGIILILASGPAYSVPRTVDKVDAMVTMSKSLYYSSRVMEEVEASPEYIWNYPLKWVDQDTRDDFLSTRASIASGSGLSGRMTASAVKSKQKWHKTGGGLKEMLFPSRRRKRHQEAQRMTLTSLQSSRGSVLDQQPEDEADEEDENGRVSCLEKAKNFIFPELAEAEGTMEEPAHVEIATPETDSLTELLEFQAKGYQAAMRETAERQCESVALFPLADLENSPNSADILRADIIDNAVYAVRSTVRDLLIAVQGAVHDGEGEKLRKFRAENRRLIQQSQQSDLSVSVIAPAQVGAVVGAMGHASKFVSSEAEAAEEEENEEERQGRRAKRDGAPRSRSGTPTSRHRPGTPTSSNKAFSRLQERAEKALTSGGGGTKVHKASGAEKGKTRRVARSPEAVPRGRRRQQQQPEEEDEERRGAMDALVSPPVTSHSIEKRAAAGRRSGASEASSQGDDDSFRSRLESHLSADSDSRAHSQESPGTPI